MFEPIEMEIQPEQPWLLHFQGQRDLELAHTDRPWLDEFRLRIGNRPIVRSMRELYGLRGVDLSPELATLPGKTYLVTHSLSMLAERNAEFVRAVGYEARFTGPGATVDLFPNCRIEDFLKAEVEFQAGIDADGHASLPDEVKEFAKQQAVPLGGDAKLHLGLHASILGKLSLSVKSPKIQAIGMASSHVSWQFDKHQLPLVGDQVILQTICVPEHVHELEFRIFGTAVIQRKFFGIDYGPDIRLTTPEHRVEVPLPQ